MLLQIAAAITNQGNRYYKRGQLLQIGANFITNWDRYYKLEKLLQITSEYPYPKMNLQNSLR